MREEKFFDSRLRQRVSSIICLSGIGTMGPIETDIPSMKKIGSLYCLDLDGSLRTMIQEVGISNGLAWSKDGKTMYYIDSTPRQMYRFDFDGSTGKIG